MQCCIDCFDARHVELLNFIRENGTPGGTCDFCRSVGTVVIDPGELNPLFEPLLDLYEPVVPGTNVYPWEEATEHGEFLADLIDEQWAIFSADVEDTHALVEEIYTSGLSPKERVSSPWSFSPYELWIDRDEAFTEPLAAIDAWRQFKEHLRHERRFILDTEALEMRPPQIWLPSALERLAVMSEPGSVYFRCRRDKQPLHKMGAPPSESATAGRANPSGISYLYLSSDRDTVVAEMRPWKGQLLSVASFELVEPALLVDLTAAQELESPFGISDLDDLRARRRDFSILAQLSVELSTPIDPSKSELDYLPTQYLTEVIRSLNYHGLLFQSAMGSGHNLVLFKPAQAIATSVECVEVSQIQYTWGNSTQSD